MTASCGKVGSMVRWFDVSNYPEVAKTLDGAYNNGLSYHGYQEISKSTGIAFIFWKLPVIFPVLREFGTASLRRIGGEGAGAIHLTLLLSLAK
jgi:hypothetical protein